MFKVRTGYHLNLNNPKSFNEKLQWLKIYDIHPEYARLVDKASVKEVVAHLVGKKYVIPNLGLWEKPEQINWGAMPNQFVLKTTGDSGGVIVCKDKNTINRKKIISRLKKYGNKNYYKYSKEYPYKYVKNRYIAEPYLEDESGELRDYKIFCFHGKPKLIQVDCNRFTGHKRVMYDTNWVKLNFELEFPLFEGDVEKPACLNEMLDVASKLSEGIPHVRVDLYCVRNHVYFGEMTFFHGSGMERFRPLEWDYRLGEWLKLRAN